MIQNIQLIGTHYPDWKVYLYMSPDVDASFVEQVQRYPNVVAKMTGKMGGINRLERLFAIDDPDVETMFVRDADSRVHWKDRWAINDFLSKPHFVAHGIRDHNEHNARMMAGMWGIHKSAGVGVRDLFEMFQRNPIDLGYGKDGVDQSFLGSYIYPCVKSKLLIHYSNNRALSGEHVVEFPFQFTENFHCGKVEGAGFTDQSIVRSGRKLLIDGRFKL
jgi:hypothetical protein